MPHTSAVVIAVTFAALVVGLTALARRLPIPVPIIQLGAGILIGLVPGLSIPALDPELVFFVFLPPVLWAAAFVTSPRSFAANARTIGRLAVSLVVLTSAAVAVVAHVLLPGVPWAVAIVLGAIVAPPDAVAASVILARLPVPRRVMAVLEGESLVNDAAALVLYRTAVVAAVTGQFSWSETLVRVVLSTGVSIAVGLGIGWLIVLVARRTADPLAETVLTLVGPYVAWMAAERLHASGVVTCVAGGLYLGRHLSSAVGPLSRLQTRSVWEVLIFLLNALIFLLLGLQFSALLYTVPPGSLGGVVSTAAVVCTIAILIRLAWVPIATVFPFRMTKAARRRIPGPPGKEVAVVAWTSMRGIVSLASALALPLVVASGAPFSYRSEIIVITACVIVWTLMLQGVTLGPLVKSLNLVPERTELEEERLGRSAALQRGAEVLDDLSRQSWVDPQDIAWLRADHRARLRLRAHHGGSSLERRRLRAGIVSAERQRLKQLRNEGVISDDVMRELEMELDLEAVRDGFGKAR